MFQSFELASDPSKGAARLAMVRAVLEKAGVQGFLVPRTDRYRGENVAPCDERLAWLTGFTGSAGAAAIGLARAAVFADSRYTLQVSSQVDRAVFAPLPVPDNSPHAWFAETLISGDVVGYDPWLHTPGELDRMSKVLAKSGMSLAPIANPIDAVWSDRPAAPNDTAWPHPVEFSGEDHMEKLDRIAAAVKEAGADSAVLTVPESIAWLLNIRGSDVPNTPVAHCSCILSSDGTARLYINPAKVSPALAAHLGARVNIEPEAAFETALTGMTGRVQLDRASVPAAVRDLLTEADILWKRDPCVVPCACKNPVELEGARRAAARDATAVIRFLAWLDRHAPKGDVTEISAAKQLEAFRRGSNALRDLSFDTISGAGANGAIVHYRVTTKTDAPLRRGELFLVDSGGQYADGTTDITRTVTIGTPPAGAVRAFTLVLKGMIAISNLRWPDGLAGRDIDAVARLALWQAGLDYGHGTGHGVGSYLGVHEGPQSISRRSHEPLLPNMILSNEPGYYKEGAFGIRIENLLVVKDAHDVEGGDKPMMAFETLTYVPIDRRLIDVDLLSLSERDWLNAYHAQVYSRSAEAVDEHDRSWLLDATAPI